MEVVGWSTPTTSSSGANNGCGLPPASFASSGGWCRWEVVVVVRNTGRLVAVAIGGDLVEITLCSGDGGRNGVWIRDCALCSLVIMVYSLVKIRLIDQGLAKIARALASPQQNRNFQINSKHECLFAANENYAKYAIPLNLTSTNQIEKHPYHDPNR
ncbi:hypothetical protein Dimus_010440 [Dionaea muscipula]